VRQDGRNLRPDSAALPADVPPGDLRHHDQLRRPARARPLGAPEVSRQGGRAARCAQTGEREGTYVVKFHGDAETGKGIVLKRDDYEGFFAYRPAMALLLEGLLL